MTKSTYQLYSPTLMEIYQLLYDEYGPRHWWPGDGPFDVIVGAILTQAASWKNVELALSNLKAADCWSFQAINACPQEELAEIVRPSGYFNAKAAKLKAFAAHVLEHYGDDLDRMFARDTAPAAPGTTGHPRHRDGDGRRYTGLRRRKTILCYRYLHHSHPGAPGHRTEDGNKRYSDWQKLFHQQLPADVPLFNEFHALLDHHAGSACRKTPVCDACCLLRVCVTGQRVET